MAGEVGIKVKLKAETRLWCFAALCPSRPSFKRSGELPYLIGINTEHQQEFVQ